MQFIWLDNDYQKIGKYFANGDCWRGLYEKNWIDPFFELARLRKAAWDKAGELIKNGCCPEVKITEYRNAWKWEAFPPAVQRVRKKGDPDNWQGVWPNVPVLTPTENPAKE